MNIPITTLIQYLQLLMAGVVDFKLSDAYAGQYKAQIEAALAAGMQLPQDVLDELQAAGIAANQALQDA